MMKCPVRGMRVETKMRTLLLTLWRTNLPNNAVMVTKIEGELLAKMNGRQRYYPVLVSAME